MVALFDSTTFHQVPVRVTITSRHTTRIAQRADVTQRRAGLRRVNAEPNSVIDGKLDHGRAGQCRHLQRRELLDQGGNFSRRHRLAEQVAL